MKKIISAIMTMFLLSLPSNAGNIEKLLTYTMHLVKKDGKLIAMKGNIYEEITEDVRKRICCKELQYASYFIFNEIIWKNRMIIF